MSVPLSVPGTGAGGYQRLSEATGSTAHNPMEEVAINVNETGTAQPAAAAPGITLIFRTLTGQQMRVTVPTLNSLSILDLKRRLEEIHNVPVNFQRLIFAGRELLDTQYCLDYGLEHECVIHLLLRQNQANPVNPNQPGGVGAGVPNPAAPMYNPANPQPVYGLPVPMDQYGNPIQFPMPGAPGVGAAPIGDLTRHSLIFRLSRVIRMFTILDLVFLVIWSLQWPFLIIAFPLALAGYRGTAIFKTNYIACYLIYVGLSIGLRIWFITAAETYFVTVLLVLGIMIELYIGSLVWKFIQLLRGLPEEERLELVARNQLLQRSMFN